MEDRLDLISYYDTINKTGKHDKTLAAIFADPPRAGIKWRDIEALFKSLGATIEERGGSRVHVQLRGFDASFHRPHPSPNTDKGAVKSVRQFLIDVGEVP
jgi:hypothetical protein